MTLYELTEQFQTLLEMIDNPDIPEDVLRDTMDAVEGEIELKADGYAKVITEAKAKIEMLKAESNRLSERAKVIENNIGRMKDNLLRMMKACGKPKFKTELFSFGIQLNPPKVVLDSEEIPEEFLVPQPAKVNTALIKDAIKNGETFDFAHLEQGEGVRIR